MRKAIKELFELLSDLIHTGRTIVASASDIADAAHITTQGFKALSVIESKRSLLESLREVPDLTEEDIANTLAALKH